jgi:hypothetical protein
MACVEAREARAAAVESAAALAAPAWFAYAARGVALVVVVLAGAPRDYLPHQRLGNETAAASLRPGAVVDVSAAVPAALSVAAAGVAAVAVPVVAWAAGVWAAAEGAEDWD